jgi:predicted transcriptional regulator
MAEEAIAQTISSIVRGNAIRVARAVIGLSQLQLAERMGISQTRLHFLEVGKATAKPEELQRIWEALSS